MKMGRGLFITFEGCEGCGKSTQIKLLFNRLQLNSIPSLLTQEPGGTPLGGKIRDMLKIKQDININPLSELLLFSASRSQLISDVINPALQDGKVVLCDRFSDSTLVYQGYGRGLNLKLIESLNTMATGGLKPDITFLLDTDPGTALKRKHDSHKDRFETEKIEFHQKIREGYINLAHNQQDRWIVIDSNQTVEGAAQIIWNKIFPALKEKYPGIKDQVI
jgi:dTMP kinase